MNEKEEEHLQNRKQKNLMVFGASESKEVTDEEFIKDLIKDVGVNAEVIFVTRIGNPTKKSRPIKVVLGTAHERWFVMYSLKNLKGKPSYVWYQCCRRLHVERSIIQECTKKVKAKNENEPSDSKYVWRVRGNPSKGLYMKRIEKRWPLSTD